jgi:hypothetical protein
MLVESNLGPARKYCDSIYVKNGVFHEEYTLCTEWYCKCRAV